MVEVFDRREGVDLVDVDPLGCLFLRMELVDESQFLLRPRSFSLGYCRASIALVLTMSGLPCKV